MPAVSQAGARLALMPASQSRQRRNEVQRTRSQAVLRITRVNPKGDPETMKLEGRVTGPWVEELSRVVHAALTESPRVVLDLSGVTFVDDGGVRLLRTLRERRAELRGESSFVASLLNGGRP